MCYFKYRDRKSWVSYWFLREKRRKIEKDWDGERERERMVLMIWVAPSSKQKIRTSIWKWPFYILLWSVWCCWMLVDFAHIFFFKCWLLFGACATIHSWYMYVCTCFHFIPFCFFLCHRFIDVLMLIARCYSSHEFVYPYYWVDMVKRRIDEG